MSINTLHNINYGAKEHMEKHIILGDIHGRTIWKDILQKEWDGNSKIVFIGDYFDTHEGTTGEKQLANFLDIIAFKDANPENVILLIGNHDYHYLDVNEKYSGYQNGWSYQFREILYKELKKLQMCYIFEDFLCSHAGVSNTWLNNNGINSNSVINNTLEQDINDLFIYKPLAFRFVGSDMYGDSIESSPIWIRERALSIDNLEDFIHIVGHTTKRKLEMPYKDIWMIDTLGTSKEYLVIKDSTIFVKQL